MRGLELFFGVNMREVNEFENLLRLWIGLNLIFWLTFSVSKNKNKIKAISKFCYFINWGCVTNTQKRVNTAHMWAQKETSPAQTQD